MTAYEYNTFLKSNKEIDPFIKDYLYYVIQNKMTEEERDSFFQRAQFHENRLRFREGGD